VSRNPLYSVWRYQEEVRTDCTQPAALLVTTTDGMTVEIWSTTTKTETGTTTVRDDKDNRAELDYRCLVLPTHAIVTVIGSVRSTGLVVGHLRLTT
jgi:hypothetical protein